MIATSIGTPNALYAALDEPNADIDLVLGQIADWYEERGDCWRAECLQWCRVEGKRPTDEGWIGDDIGFPLAHDAFHLGRLRGSRWAHLPSAYQRLADAWHAIRERGEHPTPLLGRSLPA